MVLALSRSAAESILDPVLTSKPRMYRLSVAFLLAALVAALLPGQVAYAAEPRLALLIGNSAYGNDIGRLTNPVNDLRLMETTLKGLASRSLRVPRPMKKP